VSAHTSKDIEIWLVGRLATALNMEASAIDRTADLTMYGVDSLMAVELASELSTWLGQAVPDDLLWMYSSVEEILAHLPQGSRVRPSVGVAVRAEP
jgi:acyl carrier protein